MKKLKFSDQFKNTPQCNRLFKNNETIKFE